MDAGQVWQSTEGGGEEIVSEKTHRPSSPLDWEAAKCKVNTTHIN